MTIGLSTLGPVVIPKNFGFEFCHWRGSMESTKWLQLLALASRTCLKNCARVQRSRIPRLAIIRLGLPLLCSSSSVLIGPSDHPEIASSNELKKGVRENNLSPRQKEIILAILSIYSWLSALYHVKKLNINKIKRLFGFQSEKSPKDKDEEKKTELSDKKGYYDS